MYKPKSIRKKETHKIICDFEIQTDPLIGPEQTER